MVFFYFLICALLSWAQADFSLNGTGASSAAALIFGSTFAYELEFKDQVSYAGDGSGVGTCNIMGFWQTGNTNPLAPPLATRTAEQALCGNPLTLLTPSQRAQRHPLVDFSSVDALSTALYASFPDLQVLPAVAIAIVPIYNIPELNGMYPAQPLVLSRSSIALIFSGHITYWNDSRILADNNAVVKAVLQTVTGAIKVVVRHDSSGTSNTFAVAASSFSPVFLSEIGGGSNTPPWCGSLTDEIHTIKVSAGCTSAQTISIQVVDRLWVPRTVSFACDAVANDVVQAYSTQAGTTVKVIKTFDSSGSTWTFQIGHSDSNLIKKNWYQPILLASTATVTIATFQEGGFLNAHYSGTKKTTLLTQSIFVQKGNSMFFDLSGTTSGLTTTTTLLNATIATDISNNIKAMLLASWPSSVSTVIRVVKSGSNYVEYQVAFSGSVPTLTARAFPTNVVDLTQQLASTAIYTAKFLGANAYPRFYKGPDKTGFLSTGQYTCYKRELNYLPFSYISGSVTIGVIAAVR